ncbi:dual specificity phosphatase [Yasminevirus sp. GU-2018]|uniref:Dual specificity phosphatase n=1 Tax=Yasminevirus sp. GU-2018 TaxID=2420051 RepID=A0A5K0UAV7_9VIRU|nr:dual specificity phosphatase [Yasminevirus sp. GU-2018]
MQTLQNSGNFKLHRGCLYLTLSDQTIRSHLALYDSNSNNKNIKIDGEQNRQIRDGDDYHVTVVHSSEIQTADIKNRLSTLMTELGKSDVLSKILSDTLLVGVGEASSQSKDRASCTFIVVKSKSLTDIRAKLNLLPKDLHITLGFSPVDVHDVDKSLKTIFSYSPTHLTQIVDVITDSKSSDYQNLNNYNDVMSWILSLDDKRLSKAHLKISDKLIDQLQFGTELHRKATDILHSNSYLVGLYFMSKYSNNKNTDYSSVHEKFCSDVSNDKLIIRQNDDGTVNNVLKVLNFPLTNNVKWLYSMNCERDRVFTLYTYSHKDRKFLSNETPRNFSFVTDDVAGSSIPDKVHYFDTFKELGINTVITLMETPLHTDVRDKMKQLQINYSHYAVDDREPPSQEQMEKIVKSMFTSVSNRHKVLVHCRGGVGRTAVALGGYLIALGRSRDEMMRVLQKRKTILSTSQEIFLKRWKDEIMSGRIDVGQPVDTHKTEVQETKSSSTKIKKVKPSIKLPSVVMMVGLPASGKSTTSKIIAEQLDNVEIVSQDDIREKGMCEELFSKYTKKSGTTVILDRCNPTVEERRYWLDMNLSSDKNVWCIYFDSNIEECKWRIKNRTDHPTVKASQGERIVENVAKSLVPPSLKEGFTKIEVIRSFKDANNFLLKLGCNVTELTEVNHDQIIKFPRTKHMYNLGGASRDDLILSDVDIKKLLNVLLYIEEKIDGANMGLSIKNYKIVAQNRSHYVSSAYHPQFKLLDRWIETHMKDLFDVLEDESKILYGEWVYAKHSIHYTDLPDYFVAYDLYDIAEQRFYSRPRLEKLLEKTSIKIVPLVKSDVFKTVDDIVSLVRSKSAFYDGPIEGVYIRQCGENWLNDRCKIVRNDFICGNVHWTKNILIVNKLKQGHDE